MALFSVKNQIQLASDTQVAQNVIRLENNTISKVTKSSTEDIVKFYASDGYQT